ncbi:MAG: ABC transporter transmembrane domain-containing protein, partial [Eubacteriales bacterium]|nr:ABC transporter transmembrane domain-containing protein [Eubacteriales bacterium]
MYDDIQRSEWYSLRKYYSSDMLARLSSDVDTIASVLINLLPSIIVTSVQLVLVLVILFKNDPVLACIGLVIGPVGMIVGLLFKNKYSKYQKMLKESRSEYYTFLQESLSNISVVKTFQLEDANNETFADIRNRRMNLVLKSSALSSVMSSSMKFVYSIGYVITFSWCAYRLTTSADADGVAVFTYGTMALFLSLVSQVQVSIRSLGNIVPRLYILKISSKRIREISEIQNEDYTRKGTTPREVSLSAKNVEFAYETDEGIVLSDLSFEIPAKSYVG